MPAIQTIALPEQSIYLLIEALEVAMEHTEDVDPQWVKDADRIRRDLVSRVPDRPGGGGA